MNRARKNLSAELFFAGECAGGGSHGPASSPRGLGNYAAAGFVLRAAEGVTLPDLAAPGVALAAWSVVPPLRAVTGPPLRCLPDEALLASPEARRRRARSRVRPPASRSLPGSLSLALRHHAFGHRHRCPSLSCEALSEAGSGLRLPHAQNPNPGARGENKSEMRNSRSQTGADPATFRTPFLCAVRSRLAPLSLSKGLSSMPVNPDASSHTIRVSLLPRHSSLCERRRVACASARPLRSVGCRPRRFGRHPQSRNRRFGCTGAAPGGARSGKRGWCSPLTRRRRRRRRRVRVRFAQHSGQSAASLPSPQKRHSESVAPGAAFTCALLCVAIPAAGLSPQSSPRGQRPRDPPTADRRHPVTTFPRAVFAPLTCVHSRPPARLFSSETARRAVRSAQPCPHWRSPRCGSVEGL
jgi:hypothetical protein